MITINIFLMFDITPLENSFYQNVYCTLLYSILVIVGLYMNFNRERRSIPYPRGTRFLFFGFLLFAITDFADGDYYHYWEYIQGLPSYFLSEDGLEIFYNWLILELNKNYLLFRICVWGSASVLYLLTIRRLGVNLNHCLFVMVVCFIMTFSYARATLAMALMFYGISLFLKPYNKFKLVWRSIGLVAIICSTFFHRSMTTMIIIVALAYFIPLNKKITTILLCCFPVIVVLMRIFLSDYILFYLDDEVMTRKLTGYMEADRGTANWKGMIQQFFQYSTYYLPLILSSWKLEYQKQKVICESYVYILYKIVFVTIIVATSMLFIVDGNEVLFYRYIYMTMIPITILLTYLVDENILKFNWLKIVTILGILYSFQRYSSALYVTMDLPY